jgi:hypothetical protein
VLLPLPLVLLDVVAAPMPLRLHGLLAAALAGTWVFAFRHWRGKRVAYADLPALSASM